jgi:hypothetical protein
MLPRRTPCLANPQPSVVLRETFSAIGVTRRAVILGLACISILSVVTPYTGLVLTGSNIAANHLPIGVLLLFLFLIAGVNTTLARLRRTWALTGRELLMVYVMMLVPAGVPAGAFLAFVLPAIAGAYYLATPENRFSSIIHPYLKPWLTVSDHQAVKWFYEGLPRGQHIPWALWLPALFWWAVFALAFLLSMASLAVLVRRQWIEEERLVFPLASVPLEIIGPLDARTTAGSAFFRNPWLWLGLAPVLLFGVLNNLEAYLPAWPHVQVIGITLIGEQPSGPLRELSNQKLFIYPALIGLGYLMSAEVGLSIWLFWALNKFQKLLIGVYGLSGPGGLHGWNTTNFFRNQEVGAYLLMGGFLLWSAARRARKILKSADDADAREAHQIRWALAGLAAGTVVLAAWSLAAGMSWGIMAIALAIYYLTMVALARIIASAGLFFVEISWVPSDVLIQNLGTQVVGPANLTVVYLQQAVEVNEISTAQMPFLTDSMKIGHTARVRLGPMLAAIGGGFVVAIVVSYVAGLTMIYHHGGLGMGEIEEMPRWLFNRLKGDLDAMESISTFSLTFLAVGVGVMAFLIHMNRAFIWWRLSPIGYLMGSTWTFDRIAFSVFLGWAISGMILRYGGLRPYRTMRPAFLGMIIGQFASLAILLALDAALGVKGRDLFPGP